MPTDDATPAEALAILAELHTLCEAPAPPEPLPFALQAPPTPPRAAPRQAPLFDLDPTD
jgi:hypothetical protein